MRHSRSGAQKSRRRDEMPDQKSPSSRGAGEPRDRDLRRMMNAVPVLLWSAASDGGVDFCNQQLLNYVGMSFGEARGVGWTSAIHPEDLSGFGEQWRTALTLGAPFEGQARMRGADGSYRWFSVRGTPMRDSDGQIIRWCGACADIDDLKRTQEDLLKQASRLDGLFEQTPEAVALLNADERVIRINAEFTRMFGYQPDEVHNRSIHELIVPETQIESSLQYARQLRQGLRVEAETVRRRKDGTEVYVALLAVPLTADCGDQRLTYAIYHDITERKRAEERLRESEARFQAMADTAPVMIWMTGTDGLCNYFNKPWLEFTGRTQEQEVGIGWTEGVHPDDVQGCFDGFLPAFHARRPFRMQYRLRRADGEYRWVIESGIPRYTGAGEFTGYIGSNIDITDLKRAEKERERLRQVEADLARVNRVATMGELTASLAHEINQPIAAAVVNANACARWLRRSDPDLAEACEAASRMAREARRAAEIVEKVRSLYRHVTPKREPVDVNEAIRELIVLLSETANRHSISIRTQLDERLPAITADRVQLQQVLMNLMLNGIEAMQEGSGELIVASQQTQDGQALVSVRDSGIGFSEDNLERLFEAFFTTKQEGTGMGLSISRRIIESHGGRLWATANTGRGATFQFTLPTDAS
jgi:PAS domain S-box-containing protein